jgi:hypothetical protein
LIIAAVNAAGAGVYSNVVSFVPAKVPSAPALNESVINGSLSAIIRFTAPTDAGGLEITNYEYSTDNGATYKALSPASAVPSVEGYAGLAIRITQRSSGVGLLLQANTFYVIKVRAVNAVGPGVASNYVVAQPTA